MVRVVISSDTRTPAFNCPSASDPCFLRLYAKHLRKIKVLTLAAGNAGRYETTYLGPEDALTMTPISAFTQSRLRMLWHVAPESRRYS